MIEQQNEERMSALKIRNLFALALILLMISCSAEVTKDALKDEIQNLQEELHAISLAGADEQQLRQVSKKLQEKITEYIERFPDDEMVPDLLFYRANVEAELLQSYEEAIDSLQKLLTIFPDHEHSERSLFLIGYTYSEKMEDFESAGHIYRRFQEMYPDSELISIVEFQLENMGKRPEDFDFLRDLPRD